MGAVTKAAKVFGLLTATGKVFAINFGIAFRCAFPNK